MAWWYALPAATKTVFKGTKWVKQMKKLKKGGGSTVKNIQKGPTTRKHYGKKERNLGNPNKGN